MKIKGVIKGYYAPDDVYGLIKEFDSKFKALLYIGGSPGLHKGNLHRVEVDDA